MCVAKRDAAIHRSGTCTEEFLDGPLVPTLRHLLLTYSRPWRWRGTRECGNQGKQCGKSLNQSGVVYPSASPGSFKFVFAPAGSWGVGSPFPVIPAVAEKSGGCRCL